VLDGGEALEPVADHDRILTLVDHGPAAEFGVRLSRAVRRDRGWSRPRKVVLTPL
jgi:hypothetical protein